MRVLADSSVLVAALIEAHPHYERAAPTLDRAAAGEITLLVAAHALAETYATLTAIRPQLAPAGVIELLHEGALRFAETVALNADDYRAVLNRVASLGLVSGAVYDALHVRAAEKAGAAELVTFNGRDFRRMPPAAPCRLIVL